MNRRIGFKGANRRLKISGPRSANTDELKVPHQMVTPLDSSQERGEGLGPVATAVWQWAHSPPLPLQAEVHAGSDTQIMGITYIAAFLPGCHSEKSVIRNLGL